MKDKTIDYIFRTTWQAISRMYNEEATKFGGSMAFGFALLSIDREKGTPATEIAYRMGMEPSSLTRTLKTMEEKKLIFRKPNPNDGRGVLVFLTPFGLEKREHSKQIVLRFNESVKNKINPEKIETFIEVAETINNIILEKNIFNQTELI